MTLPELCIRRPVFATVLSLILVLIGLMAFSRLTIREYPNIDEPQVSVSTGYNGASAEIIETQVTQVLEGSLAGIEGIDTIESTSRAESSRITIRFRPGISIDSATSDVRDRVSRVRRQLPDEIDEPNISKVEADAQAIIYLVMRSSGMTALELTDYVDRFVVDRFKNLDGVADVSVNGERRYVMRVWLDPGKLAGYGVTVQDVEAAIRSQNAEIPAGRVESTDREFTVLSRTSLGTAEEFARVILKPAGGLQVSLGDVARVELGTADVRRESRYDGQTAISIGIVKQAVANPLDVAIAVKRVLPTINESMPEGTSIEVGFDSTVFIDRSINNVFITILEATGLVVIIIFLFLHSFRAAIIPVVTIPVSLLTAFAIMYATGLTINTLTLLAFVLAIGLVVDDAIVMLENIYRHVEEGMKPFDAAIRGAREVGFAVIAMTMTLAAVYAPIAFTPGRTGRLFMEFAVTLAGAVVVSGFVALTLTPMMSSKLLKHSERENFFSRTDRETSEKPRPWLQEVAAPGAAAALDGHARRPWHRRRRRPAADPAQIRTFAHGRPGRGHGFGKYAGRIKLCLYAALCGAGGSTVSGYTRPALSAFDCGCGRSDADDFFRAPQGLERTHDQPAGNRAEPAAEAAGHRRHPGVRLKSCLTGGARLWQAHAVRHPVVRLL